MWFPVWQLDILASSSDGKHIPIPSQNCPIILHKPVLAISVSNPLGKPEWFSAGFLQQNIRSPLIVGANFNTYVASRRIMLGEAQLINFLDINVADYAVVFQPRRWHKQIQLVMWEYQGTIERD
jgi:hypothetical protein